MIQTLSFVTREKIIEKVLDSQRFLDLPEISTEFSCVYRVKSLSAWYLKQDFSLNTENDPLKADLFLGMHWDDSTNKSDMNNENEPHAVSKVTDHVSVQRMNIYVDCIRSVGEAEGS